MSKSFFVEFTGEDRIKFEIKLTNNQLKGMRIKYQSARKTQKVNYSVVGFEPFFEYEWITIIKYDNLKGEAIRDFMKPTPVSFSPHGLHVKESWGTITHEQFLEKVLIDIKDWQEHRRKYDDSFPPAIEEYIMMAEKNYKRMTLFLKFLLDFKTNDSIGAFNSVYENQTLIPIPMPEEDDWLLEQNSVSANRIEKRAHRGDPDIVRFGDFKVLTYQRSGDEQA